MKATIKVRKAGEFTKEDYDLFRRYVNLFNSHNLSIKIEIQKKSVKQLKLKRV
jgi:hypothetical protein